MASKSYNYAKHPNVNQAGIKWKVFILNWRGLTRGDPIISAFSIDKHIPIGNFLTPGNVKAVKEFLDELSISKKDSLVLFENGNVEIPLDKGFFFI